MACSGHSHSSANSTVVPASARYLAQAIGRWLSEKLNGMAQVTTATDCASRSAGRITVAMESSDVAQTLVSAASRLISTLSALSSNFAPAAGTNDARLYTSR